MASSHPRQDDHRHDRAPMPSLPPPPPHSFAHAQAFAPGPPQHMFSGSQLGMHMPSYPHTAPTPGYMPYGMPPRKVPKIRHPNRAPCTVPSKTLYIRNLRESIKIPVLVKALSTLFETYGEVAEVRARHSIRMRGQAFVVFKSMDDAAKAHHEVQGFVLFDKPMFIEFSRVASDATVVNEGGDIEEHKHKRIAEKDKREQDAQEKAAQAVSNSAGASAAAMALEPELPNKILFLQGLPADVKVSEIEAVFSAYPGFVEVRWVAVKPDVAFVEYESDAQAGMAKSTIGQQWSVREDQPPVSVSFARR
ncbi:hypothetical protein IW140_004142 [Coemansia sp. RSA 1813]|nr:hypothetical protein EV178_004157 [Coemansia sp. RSA 1646]KAJ1770945.1 hypothetical protein LPJ74_002745 [Coemansia sp. RSA 1843]KAJ2088264.1 hypothetical protein IW138_004341 [Coemansia sp. RSA 986]KAJ2213273.1 hypothetical protein EV179_003965 [Coemansia sp. RSA 487]KAJ2568145.1 hypothetical protein IW140_004142 [Coemansia sp. RSA 1813]